MTPPTAHFPTSPVRPFFTWLQGLEYGPERVGASAWEQAALHGEEATSATPTSGSGKTHHPGQPSSPSTAKDGEKRRFRGGKVAVRNEPRGTTKSAAGSTSYAAARSCTRRYTANSLWPPSRSTPASLIFQPRLSRAEGAHPGPVPELRARVLSRVVLVAAIHHS